MREILQLESHVVHARGAAAKKVHCVMVGIAAHENELVAEPVRHFEAERALVELNDLFKFRNEESDMADLQRADASDVAVDVEKRPLREQLKLRAAGVCNDKRMRCAGERIAPQLRWDAEDRELFAGFRQIDVWGDFKRQAGAMRAV